MKPDLTTLEGNLAACNLADDLYVRMKKNREKKVMNQLHVGDRVRYQPSHYGLDEWENGIVKEVRPGVTDAVWVVYHCAGNWKRYTEYTSAKTDLRDLKVGWR